MTESLVKNTFREIRYSLGRFLAIVAIIALGVGFFSGIKATPTSMYSLAEEYYSQQNLMDFRLLSTVGFDKDDIKAIGSIDGVTDVMPSYFCDAIAQNSNSNGAVRLMALPYAYDGSDMQNCVVLKDGRFPEKTGEIAVEYSSVTSSKFKIGDTVIFEDTAGETDMKSVLKTLEFTVVGYVDSPLYISYQRGTTTIGNGKITEFMYITPDDFSFERYTELFVKTDISDKYSAFSEEYKSEIDSFSDKLTAAANERCETFSTEVIGKARDELNSSKNEYNTQKTEAENQLADAEKKLKDGRAELDNAVDEAQQKLDEARAKIQSGESDLETAKNEYYNQISAAEQILNDKSAQLEEARLQYENGKTEYDRKIFAAEKELQEYKEQYEAGAADYENNKKALIEENIRKIELIIDGIENVIEITSDEKVVSLLNTALDSAHTVVVKLQEHDIIKSEEFAQKLINAIDAAQTYITDGRLSARLQEYMAQAQNMLNDILKQQSEAEALLAESKAKIDAAEQEFEIQKKDGKAKLDSAKAQIDESDLAISAARKELAQKKTEGYNKLLEAELELKAAKEQYDSGEAGLAEMKSEGEKKLSDGRVEYENEKSKAEKQFDDAEQKLIEAQSKIDEISEPKWYVLDRDDNAGYSSFSQNVNKLDAVASVFPVFFLLVAVLVCVTTMTRLIEEKRIEIGTFKALGYSNLSIIMKFVIYSLTAGLLGSFVGIIIGINTIPYVIYNSYKIMYYIGDITLVPNLESIITGSAAAVLCTSAVSVIVCRRSLRQKLSVLMRPKAPKIGKRIFLENIPGLWKRMNFTAKLTARNLLRYKVRLCMTVIGVAGCCALIVAGYGLQNSFVPLTDDQFETIYLNDVVLVPNESGTAEELEYLVETAEKTDNAEEYMLLVQEEADVEFGGETKLTDTYVEVIEDTSKIGKVISLHTRKDKTELALSDNGVLINEGLANDLGISIGDTICVSSDSGYAEVKVEGIFEQYIHNQVYMSSAMYKKLYDVDPEYNAMHIVLKDDSDAAEEKFSEICLADSRIAAVNYMKENLDDFRNMLSSLNLVVMVMIICAAALAFVVLYNLTNINIAERVREIATFKVLGFKNTETTAFIFLENIILTIIGIAAGLILGIFLSDYIVQTVEVDGIMLGREIFASTFLYASGLTMLFSLIVLFVMSFKIKAVNMVESLKSVE